MNPVLILADSRGRNLGSILHGLANHDVTVAVYPGAGILSTISKANSLLTRRDWTQVYILSGLCDLTVKDKKTRRVHLRFEEPQQLLSHYHELLVSAYDKLSIANDLVSCKQIFAPLTGIDLALYNNTDADSQQEILNTCIELVNTEIATFNRSKNVYTPWTSRTIHHHSRGKYHARYERLSQDGCHLSPSLNEYWAHTLIETFEKNV